MSARLVPTALTIASLAIAGLVLVAVRERTRTVRLSIAAGSATGESHVLATALEAVVAAQYPRIQLSVVETGGTAESLRMLEHGDVMLAAAQADVAIGETARMVAVLYEDTFQLLVRKGSSIHRFADLRGRRIALPRSGGQYQSFLHVAEHFGVPPAECTFVGSDDAAAERAFEGGQADALFRVRALGNPAVARLVRGGEVDFIPIEQAPAMQIRLAAFRPSLIPQGAYSGAPAVPPADLVSVGVQRTLLAHRDADEDAVRTITSLLMEGRQQLANAIPDEHAEVRALLAGLKRPDAQFGIGAPIHAGAQQYYDKDKPAFVEEYADFVALVLTVVLLLGSWAWELRRLFSRGQKNVADHYNHEVVTLITRAEATSDPQTVEEIRLRLFKMLTEVVCALDEDRISEESFQSFRVVWQIAIDLLRERRSAARPTRTARLPERSPADDPARAHA